MSNWVGYAVSVNCGEPLGCYQGTILEADGNTITLTKAFRNGFPYPKSQVTLNAADIKELKIIEERAEPAGQTHSTVAVSKSSKKVQRATVCENLQANPSSSGNQASSGSCGRGGNGAAQPVRSKPIDIQCTRTNKNNNHAGSYGAAGSTPKGAGTKADKARRRNEACFGDGAQPPLDRDFDFEGNLALFDKRALWEQMNSQKPDLLRQADEGRAKFRHDENVLGGGGGEGEARGRRAILVPAELRGARDYVTDEAVRVPSVAPALRRRLWEGLARAGLLPSAQALLARGAADVALRLVGGGRRLEARNAHQAPRVAVLAAPVAAAAAGLLAARLLAAHAVRVACFVAPGDAPGALRQELAALAPSGAELVPRLERLPRVDLVLLALFDPAMDEPQDHYGALVGWARAARAPCVALEPPAAGWEALPCRAAVVAPLPAALAPSLGRVYLACVGAPAGLFADLHVAYRPPFGASALLALHPADD